jgi:hypothetical protein
MAVAGCWLLVAGWVWAWGVRRRRVRMDREMAWMVMGGLRFMVQPLVEKLVRGIVA